MTQSPTDSDYSTNHGNNIDSYFCFEHTITFGYAEHIVLT